VPSRAYNGEADLRRRYLDTHVDKFVSGRSVFDTLEEFRANTFNVHSFPRDGDDTSTTATVRLTASGAIAPARVICAALSHHAIVLTYENSRAALV
jgi:hypothetical protein